jgi:hypothetical protein
MTWLRVLRSLVGSGFARPAEASFVPYLVLRVLAEAQFVALTTSADPVSRNQCFS